MHLGWCGSAPLKRLDQAPAFCGLMGWSLRYVIDLQSHSNGPKRKCLSHQQLTTIWREKSTTATSRPATFPRLL